MHRKPVKATRQDSTLPTRRDVLRAAAAAGLSALACPGAMQEQVPASQPAATAPATSPWWMLPPYTQSRVVDIRSTEVFEGSLIDEDKVQRLLTDGMLALTDESSGSKAWRAVLRDAKRIVVKFNSVGAEVIGTSRVVGRAIVTSLLDAGYDRQCIILAEAPKRGLLELGVGEASPDWGDPIPVGTNMEQVARYVWDADAIIDVPFLKTHRIAGMSGCMKNLSHAVIRHPALYHDGGCAPFVGQVISNTVVSSRLRLCVVDALRIVMRNGPDAKSGDLLDHGGLLLGFDPVAIDTVGLSLLSLRRRLAGIDNPLSVPSLTSAATLGAGRVGIHEIEQVVIGADA